MTQENQVVLTAADIESAADIELKAVDVPEWGGRVYIRSLGADDGIALSEGLEATREAKNPHEGMYLILAACLCDAQGDPLFPDAEAAKKVLRKRKSDVLLRLQQEASQLNGWSQEAQEKAKNGSGEAGADASPSA